MNGTWFWICRTLTLGACLVFASAAAPTAHPSSQATLNCDRAPAGELLVQERLPAGAAKADLTVIDPATGDARGTISIPAVDVAFPTALPHRALAVAGRDLYLVDSEELTAEIVPLDGEPATDLAPNPVQFRGTAGNRFTLLGSPSFDRAYLVDVKTGKATSLTALIPAPAPGAPVFIPFAAVTPGDGHVVLWDGRHVYVVATDNPSRARLVDSGEFAFAPDVSPDGQQLIYSASDGPGTGSTLLLEAIDGSTSEAIKTSNRAIVTLWIPDTRSILVDERTESGAAAGSASVLGLDSREETPLVTYRGSLTTVQFSPTGSRALLGVEMVGGGNWHLADLTTGAVEELPQLAGSRVLPGLYADSRWALAVPLGDGDDPLAGPSYRGVDLESGSIARLMEQPRELLFLRQPVLSPDGRFALVIGQTDDRETLWLLDAAELRANELAAGVTVTGLFAPDGCHIAVTTESAVDGIAGFSIRLASTGGEVLFELDAGVALAWIDA